MNNRTISTGTTNKWTDSSTTKRTNRSLVNASVNPEPFKWNDKIIAVYGTLKRGFGNHRLVRDCTFLGEDFVPFNKITGTWFPIAKFEGADKSKLLKIELYQVHTIEQLENLDSLEWHPTWYRRTQVTTENGIIAEIYDMFSRDFEDDSHKFAIPNTTNKFEWTTLNY